MIAALEDYPKWSDTHKKFTIVSRDGNGRPTQALVEVSVAGRLDEQVLSYSWTENSVRTTLVKSSGGTLKSQESSYVVAPSGSGSRVTYEITAEPAIPAPGFLVKKALKKVVDNATTNLARYIERCAPSAPA